jgi:hypothetical protein
MLAVQTRRFPNPNHLSSKPQQQTRHIYEVSPESVAHPLPTPIQPSVIKIQLQKCPAEKVGPFSPQNWAPRLLWKLEMADIYLLYLQAKLAARPVGRAAISAQSHPSPTPQKLASR